VYRGSGEGVNGGGLGDVEGQAFFQVQVDGVGVVVVVADGPVLPDVQECELAR